ncbi:MAG TPA: transcriptional regulator, partial [Burkholderiaceae bacterium]|nr:transcriptional regulator [Burkholderiaceae bacterium]
MTFARTKIQPPRRRAGLIPRPALDAQLAEVLATRRLVVLCAPAGFGKTAVLTRQIERLSDGPAPAWVSIDEDDDLQRLLECLFAALEPFDLPWRIAPEALGASVGHTRSERRAVADELLNMLAATDIPRGLIVLDDLHRAEDPAVFEFLDLLIERLPDHWGLVVASRFDPPLALGRLRAAGEMAEFRMADLRFDAHEVLQLGELLSPGHTRPVSEGDVELLLARTGGWAAGLRLALASVVARRPPLKSGPSEGIEWASSGRTMDRHVFDYLASEVLGQMPVELRDFLLRCSVLSELTPERCAAVSGDRHAAERLAEIERRELFVSVLEGTERTLRLHDLFRDFLDDRLRQEHPDEVPMLLERAAAGETDPLRRTT